MQTGHCFQERKEKNPVPSATPHPSSVSRPVTGLMAALEIKYSEVSYRKHTGLSNVTQNYSGRGQNYVLAEEFGCPHSTNR